MIASKGRITFSKEYMNKIILEVLKDYPIELKEAWLNGSWDNIPETKCTCGVAFTGGEHSSWCDRVDL